MPLWLLLAMAALPARAVEDNIATTEIIISHGPPPRGPAIDEVMPGLLRCRDTLPSRFSASIAVLGRLEAEAGKGRLNDLKVEKAGTSTVEAALVRCVLKELTLAALPLPAQSGIALRYRLHFRLAPPPGPKAPGKVRAGLAKAVARKPQPAAQPEPQPQPAAAPRLFPKPIHPRPRAAPAPKPKAAKALPEEKKPRQSDEDAKAREAIRQAAVSALKLVVDGCFRRSGKPGSGQDKYLTLRFNVVLAQSGEAGFDSVSPGVASTAEAAVSDCALREVRGVTFRIAPELAKVFPPEGLETSYPFTATSEAP